MAAVANAEVGRLRRCTLYPVPCNLYPPQASDKARALALTQRQLATATDRRRVAEAGGRQAQAR